MASDAEHMQRAITLAKEPDGTAPNPRVGAVVVRDGEVIGEGYHRGPGTAHAERAALEDVGEDADGATLYVTLAPCDHHGCTPPCTAAIVDAGIDRVVVALDDDAPVSGDGINVLREAGITVETGIAADAARPLLDQHEPPRDRPYIAVKSAMTLDGKLATKTGDASWISGEAARARVHELRDRFDAIMVGVGTVISDDPRLTARPDAGGGDDPLRIVLDEQLDIPLDATVVQDEHETVLVTDQAREGSEDVGRLREQGVDIRYAEDRRLAEFLQGLRDDGIEDVLVEGGGATNWELFAQGLVDRLYLFIAPTILGGDAATTLVDGDGVERVADGFDVDIGWTERVGDDLLVHGYPR